MRRDCRDAVPISRTFEEIRGDAAVNRQGCGSGPFDRLRYVDGVDLVARAAEADLGRDRRRSAGGDDALDDLPHAIGPAQQVRPAMGLLRDLLHRAAEVNVDDTDLELASQ